MRTRAAVAAPSPPSPRAFTGGSIMISHDETRAAFELARPGQVARLMTRALRLRCPNCGKGPVLRHWLKLEVRCGTCGLRMERGEHDYFVGSLLFNFALAGGLLLAFIAVLVATTLPDVPWDTLEVVGPLGMLLVPVVLFPFSKLLWLAFDLMLRPVTPEELEWHRAADAQWSTRHDVKHDS